MPDNPKIYITLPSGEVRKYSLQMDSIRIGRAQDNTVVIEDNSLSAHHAVLHLRDSGYELVDLGSTNGLEIGGQRIYTHALRDGDVVKIGAASLRFEHPAGIHNGPEEIRLVPPAPVPYDSIAEKDNAAAAPPPPVWQNAPMNEKGGGCMGAMLVFMLTLLAPIIGLHVHHWQKTGKILAVELINYHLAKSSSPAAK